MKTYLPKNNLDQRKWHVVDASGAILGRLAVQIANILRGKDKPIYTDHLDAGDFVVVRQKGNGQGVHVLFRLEGRRKIRDGCPGSRPSS
jgi:hypothetical protein